MSITKKTMTEFFVIYIGFGASIIDSSILNIYLIFISIYLIITDQAEGAIKAFFIIQLRSLINPGIGASMEDAAIVKWCCVFGLVFYISYLSMKAHNSPKKYNILFLLLLLFEIVIMISGFLNSSYPIIVIFKSLSYAVVFYSVVKGILLTESYDWIRYLQMHFWFIICVSIFLYPTSVGFFRNGYSFQGIFNHPNVLAVILALGIANCFLNCKCKLNKILTHNISQLA